MGKFQILRAFLFSAILVGWAAGPACAEEAADGWLDVLTFSDSDQLSLSLRALAMVTILGVLPSAILLTTCFPRILIVLSFLRRALGAPDLPPNLVVVGLSLLLTIAIMFPIWREIYDEAYVPYAEAKTMTSDQALEAAELPLKRFMLEHLWRSDKKSLRLFYNLANRNRSEDVSPPQKLEDLSFFVVLPAFVLSELKIAFQMGFLIFLPFVLIDLVVSSVLVSMGMFMLPPNLVSLPIKILVFVLVDGWSLVVAQLASSLGAMA